MLKDKELKDLLKKYEFMYLDFIDNFISIDYFAIVWNIKVKRANHILDAGQMLIYKQQHLN